MDQRRGHAGHTVRGIISYYYKIKTREPDLSPQFRVRVPDANPFVEMRL